MRREIETIKGPRRMDYCCPGHDEWPNDTYRNRRYKKARSRDKKLEHRYARHIHTNALRLVVRDGE